MVRPQVKATGAALLVVGFATLLGANLYQTKQLENKVQPVVEKVTVVVTPTETATPSAALSPTAAVRHFVPVTVKPTLVK